MGFWWPGPVGGGDRKCGGVPLLGSYEPSRNGNERERALPTIRYKRRRCRGYLKKKNCGGGTDRGVELERRNLAVAMKRGTRPSQECSRGGGTTTIAEEERGDVKRAGGGLTNFWCPSTV